MTSPTDTAAPLPTPTRLPQALRLTDAERERMHADYVHLHRHPELSMQEHETAAWIERQLDEIGVEHFRCGGTGVVGILRHPESPEAATVAFRADFDGLPILEDTGLDYASTARGTLADGRDVPVMHGCGHDTHVMGALTAARQLVKAPETWQGTVVFVFQPGEETGAGAAAMVADGLWDRAPRPEVVLGQHVMPLEAGSVYVIPGTAMALADSLRVTFHGKQAHGSQPQDSIDPIVMASHAVARLQTVVSREVDPRESAVVTVGTFHAGLKENIIPAEATIELNIRTFTPERRDQVVAAVERIVKAEAAASGAPEPTVEPISTFPRCYNDPEHSERVSAALRAELGAEQVTSAAPFMGSEDVGALADAIGVPLVYWHFGGFQGEPEQYPVNHHPAFGPVIAPTLEAGHRAALAGLLAYIGRS
ncbi:amidohydrolase [Micrococcus sp. FDAARGOS_333]|uniref:amidohydrolase n=1 Tax=Micrococcus sp. FDAARGOS_333 TaxID=1930558 RepID=UPI000B4DF9AC|nr:amidohydrolase [Micrococcus sp. FDAARGOS_333]PNL17260.1 amidohydrolase [Micrococcus sp. FDAARGOS_333]